VGSKKFFDEQQHLIFQNFFNFISLSCTKTTTIISITNFLVLFERFLKKVLSLYGVIENRTGYIFNGLVKAAPLVSLKIIKIETRKKQRTKNQS